MYLNILLSDIVTKLAEGEVIAFYVHLKREEMCGRPLNPLFVKFSSQKSRGETPGRTTAYFLSRGRPREPHPLFLNRGTGRKMHQRNMSH